MNTARFEPLESRQMMAATLDANLVVNGGFEASVGATAATPSTIPGWTTNGGMAVVRYGARFFPGVRQKPANGGANLLSGATGVLAPTASQRINVSSLAKDVDAGRLTYDLTGQLGGFGRENDRAYLTIKFFDGKNRQLALHGMSGPGADDRVGLTGFRSRRAVDVVPIGTRAVIVEVSAYRHAGVVADGYADNVSLKLSKNLTGAIVGNVFNDTNGDGFPNEPVVGLAGVTVYADLNHNANLDAGEPRTTSGANGSYRLGGVRLGRTTLRQIAPATLRSTFGTKTLDLDPEVLERVGPNFLLSQTILIKGNVFADNNANGRRDADEGAFAGARVMLEKVIGPGPRFPAQFVTADEDGDYSFIVSAGKYRLRIQPGEGTAQSTPPQNRAIPLSLAKGQTSLNNIFGVRRI